MTGQRGEFEKPILYMTSGGEPMGVGNIGDVANQANYLALDLAVHHSSPAEIADVLAKHESKAREAFGGTLVGALNVLLLELLTPALDEWDASKPGIKRALRDELARIEKGAQND